jgi:short-chain fatty acids transporter
MTMSQTSTTDFSGSDAGLLERMALRITDWSERWYPDAFVFAVMAVVVVAAGCLAIGASPKSIALSFGDGFWSLIPFTLQVCVGVVIGYVVAHSGPAAWLIAKLATVPKTGRGAVAYIALVSMLVSLFSWTISLIFGGLLVRAIARRQALKMDYRAASAAGYMGIGATWALGVSSAAAQIQANPASLPKALIAITGVISFHETVFLWQSILMAAVLIVVTTWVAYLTAPGETRAKTAKDLGVDLGPEAFVSRDADTVPAKVRPGEWLEFSPLPTIFIVALGAVWLTLEFSSKGILAISNLNTYNFFFIMLGLLLHWRPRRFLVCVSEGIPSIAGVLFQFPLYGSIAYMLIQAKGPGGSLAELVAGLFVQVSSQGLLPVTLGIYSAVLGFFLPSGGGKWIVEAPYAMQAANDLKVHLGWMVQVYNAAEALPNLINPFWMLPILGILGLKARDIIGFTCTQFLIHLPLVLFMVWILGMTLTYHPPIMP